MDCIDLKPDTTIPAVLTEALEQKKDVKHIRLFSLNFLSLEPIERDLLEKLLNSRKWERVVLTFCSNNGDDLPESFKQGILNTQCLELYGSTLGLLDEMCNGENKQPSVVKTLKLRTRLDRVSVIPLARILTCNESLKELHLTCEFAGLAATTALAESFRENKFLDSLTFYSCEMFDEESTEALIRSLVGHPTLAHFALQDSYYSGMAAIVEMVSRTNVLQTLQLYCPPHLVDGRSVPQLNIEALSFALKQNQSLKSLDLSNNRLRDEAAVHLAEALQVNCTLETLNLQSNKIKDEGAIRLGEALPKMKGLKNLYLWNNKFEGAGSRALLAGIKQNTVLEDLTTFSKFRIYKEMRYYCNLNHAGRYMLKGANSIPLSAWACVLNRVNSKSWDDEQKSSVLYSLMREQDLLTAIEA